MIACVLYSCVQHVYVHIIVFCICSRHALAERALGKCSHASALNCLVCLSACLRVYCIVLHIMTMFISLVYASALNVCLAVYCHGVPSLRALNACSQHTNARSSKTIDFSKLPCSSLLRRFCCRNHLRGKPERRLSIWQGEAVGANGTQECLSVVNSA